MIRLEKIVCVAGQKAPTINLRVSNIGANRKPGKDLFLTNVFTRDSASQSIQLELNFSGVEYVK